MGSMKKQHYVPQFYLRNFSYNSLFNVFLLNKNDCLKNIPIKGQCQLKNYYDRGDDQTWEMKLSKLENEWAKTIRATINSTSGQDINEEIRQSLINFGLFQSIRSTAARDSYISRSWETIKTSIIMQENDINEEQLDDLKMFYYEKNNHVPATLLDMLDSLTPLVQDLSVKVIKYNCEETLISSDNPILITNRIYPTVGFANAGLMYIYPISPSVLVIVYDKKIYKNKDSFVISKNNKEIRELNKLQLLNANQVVFGLDDFSFCSVKKLSNNLKKERLLHWKRILGVDKLGDTKNKLIVHQNHRLKISVLSFNNFTELGYKISGLGIQSIDWFPRNAKLFPEYESRIENKMLLAKAFPNDPNLKGIRFNITKIQKFNKLLDEYWDIIP